MVLAPAYCWFQSLSWVQRLETEQDPAIVGCETCWVEHSIASTVVLDPVHGTATKTYKPPGVVRLLYFRSSQARFPYESNEIALNAVVYRRRIASFLTPY